MLLFIYNFVCNNVLSSSKVWSDLFRTHCAFLKFSFDFLRAVYFSAVCWMASLQRQSSQTLNFTFYSCWAFNSTFTAFSKSKFLSLSKLGYRLIIAVSASDRNFFSREQLKITLHNCRNQQCQALVRLDLTDAANCHNSAFIN